MAMTRRLAEERLTSNGSGACARLLTMKGDRRRKQS